MNNIEKLAIDCGFEILGTNKKNEITWLPTTEQLEAFAKALQSSEPLAVEKVEALLNKHKASIFKTIDVIPVSDGDVLITQDQLLNLISEYTHPPASVPLEKYNKLLEILKQAKIVIHITWNSSHANRCDAVLDAIRQAIAEAEGKEG